MDKKKTVKEEKKEEKPDESLMHEFGKEESAVMFSSKIIIILVIIALLGIGTGYVFANKEGTVGISQSGKVADGKIQKGQVFGVKDTGKFKDQKEIPEGKLVTGGIDGEGQYHIERGEDTSQWVYLTSSTIDLSQFVNRKVKAWGETHHGQKAGWLMDVERVEVLD